MSVRAPSSTESASAAPALARPELLAPAGDWECVRAAIENGADAVYFGLERFNARMRAKNFTQADLPELMHFLHRRGVRGYVTFNTLVFTRELEDAADYLRTIIRAGVDAAIVQDVGVCRLIRQLSPDFPIHCSTQMTITSAAGVEFAHELGAQLVVLARENSLAEINTIQSAQAATGRALPLEVFVHGALCVAYSGQCLTSESLGGRSANRGECAQACRLPYELVSDGQKVELGDRKYLLSPQDLAGLEVLPELVRAGVASLKIEGRLKSPEYVASITRVYRTALDRVLGTSATPAATTAPDDAKRARYELEMSFSRGLYTGWFRGINNQELAHGRFGTKRGVFLGTVTRVQREQVHLRLEAPVKPGDGIVFDAGRPEAGEQGGRIYSVATRGPETVLGFGRGDIDFAQVHVGDRVWKTSDPALQRELRTTFEGEQIRFQQPITIEVHGEVGTPLILIAKDAHGHCAQVRSAMPLIAADHQPLTEQRLRDQLGRLGGTPFRLGQLINETAANVLLPLSELNRLRRELVGALEAQRTAPQRWTLQPINEVVPAAPENASRAVDPEIIAVTRDLDQFDAALSCTGLHTFYCEFENPKHYREAVARFQRWRDQSSATSSATAPTLWVAAPRVFKPGEDWILSLVRSCQADGYLVRNAEHLRFFAGSRVRGDFSLNVANPLSARYFLNRYKLERVTASYDLNVAQLEDLLRAGPADRFDITLHQRMPMFHMEHCVFCAFLSSGKDYHDCGRPCEKHRVALRDRVGAELPLKADAGCRNTVYNNRAQTGAEFAQRLIELGARHFRIEFVHESADEVRRTLQQYQRLLRGEVSGADLWRELKLVNQLGVTRGQLETTPQVIFKKR